MHVRPADASQLWQSDQLKRLREADLHGMMSSLSANERTQFGVSLLDAADAALTSCGGGSSGVHACALLSACCCFALQRLSVDDTDRGAFQQRLVSTLQQGVERLFLGHSVSGNLRRELCTSRPCAHRLCACTYRL